MKIRREVWAESWKRHFRPIEVGGKLLLKPSWSRRKPRKGQKVVVLDPGLSFGTGQHPTTAYCLRELVRHRVSGRPQSLLDLGCGSGILAIAAARIGYSPVLALDFDPDAVRIARENARRNRLMAKVGRRSSASLTSSSGRDAVERVPTAGGVVLSFQRQDVRLLPLRPRIKYFVICANLTSDLLLAERERILAGLRKGGVLVLAGILKTEFERVQKAYEAAGVRLIASHSEGEWKSGTLRLKFV